MHPSHIDHACAHFRNRFEIVSLVFSKAQIPKCALARYIVKGLTSSIELPPRIMPLVGGPTFDRPEWILVQNRGNPQIASCIQPSQRATFAPHVSGGSTENEHDAFVVAALWPQAPPPRPRSPIAPDRKHRVPGPAFQLRHRFAGILRNQIGRRPSPKAASPWTPMATSSARRRDDAKEFNRG